MNRSEQLHRLTEAGQAKLRARYFDPENPCTLKNIRPIDSRTFNKILDGRGVRRGRIIALFELLDIPLETADFEPVAYESSISATESVPVLEDSGIPAQRRSAKRRIPKRVAAVGAVVVLVAFVGVLAMLNGTPKADGATPTAEDVIARLGELRNSENPGLGDVNKQVAALCLELAERAYHSWYGKDDELWVERLQQIDGDLEASLEWLSKSDPARAVQLAAALSRYWSRTERIKECEKWLLPASDSTIALSDAERARGLLALSSVYIGNMTDTSGRALGYARDAERLFRIAGDPNGAAFARRMQGIQQWILGKVKLALETCKEAYAMFEMEDDRVGMALSQFQIATYSSRGGLPYNGTPVSVREMVKARDMFRALGNTWGQRISVDHIQGAARYLPLSPDSDPYVRIAKNACLEETKDANQETRRVAWEHLVGIADRNKNEVLTAECLFGLYKDDTRSATQYRKWRRLGALLQHCSKMPGYRSLLEDVEITRKSMAPFHWPTFAKYIAQGRRIPLAVAVQNFGEL